MRALKKPGGRKLVVIATAFIGVPLLFYLTMSLTQNVAFRFYCPIMLTFPLLASIVYRHSSARRFWLLMSLCTVVQLPVYVRELFVATTPVGVLGIAKSLGDLPYKGRIMSSEAGVLAYYSGWETFDIVGLNTPKVALERLQPEDVGLFDPDVVLLAHSVAIADDRSCAMVRSVYRGVSGGKYEHFRLAELYHMTPMAIMLDWHTYAKPTPEPAGEFWIKRNSLVYANVRHILEANGATPSEGARAFKASPGSPAASNQSRETLDGCGL